MKLNSPGKKVKKNNQSLLSSEQQIHKQEEQNKADQKKQSGIVQAYKYFLKSVAEDGMNVPNIFEYAAQKVLKYEKLLKIKQKKQKQLEQYNRGIIQKNKNV